MDEKKPPILDDVAAELKARLQENENEPTPAKITAKLFALHKAENKTPRQKSPRPNSS